MSEVFDVLELARQHGVEVEARGEELHLSAPAKPPQDVLDALKLHKPKIMAALAAASFETPQEWRDGVSKLLGTPPPEGMAPESWMLFLASCDAFMAGPWPGKAVGMGWTAFDLFGCHKLKPVERVDRMGLLWLLRGGRIAVLASETAIIEMVSGSRLTYRVKHTREAGDVLAWELR